MASKEFTIPPCQRVFIAEFEHETLSVSDEWDTNRIIDDNVLLHRMLMIRVLMPCTVMSHICKRDAGEGS